MARSTLVRTRQPRRRLALVAFGSAAALLVIGVSGCAAWRLNRSAALADQSESYQQQPQDPALSLLIVGDSTGVGTGASSSSHSLAGLMGSAYPRLLIDNRAADGARFEQVVQQLQAVERHYDFVLIQAGGNDVIRLTDEADLAAQIGRAVALARQHADTVLVMPSGNVGSAPFFSAPLSWWMTRRSQMLHRLMHLTVAGSAVVYVDLYREPADDPFAQDPALNASDGLHPSDSGYRQWWFELQQQANLAVRFASAR